MAAGYEAPPLETLAALNQRSAPLKNDLPKLQLLKALDDGKRLAFLAHYQLLICSAVALSATGTSFEEIAGNRDKIVVSIMIPVGGKLDLMTCSPM